MFTFRTKKPTPSVQGIDKAIIAIDERLKKLENLLKQSNKENNEGNDRVVSVKKDRYVSQSSEF